MTITIKSTNVRHGNGINRILVTWRYRSDKMSFESRKLPPVLLFEQFFLKNFGKNKEVKRRNKKNYFYHFWTEWTPSFCKEDSI